MIIKLYSKNNSQQDILKVVNILNDGGTVIYPTDTRYAMGCHALKERAVEKICRLKGIDPRKNNLSIICKDLRMVSEFTKIDNHTFRLLKRNLPGPFTFILNGNNRLPKIYKNRKEVGIRIPDNSIITEIIQELNAPIMTATLPLNVNEDIEYGTNPELMNEKFGEFVDLIVDGGEGDTELSTVVNCLTDEPEVVRQGKGILKEV